MPQMFSTTTPFSTDEWRASTPGWTASTPTSPAKWRPARADCGAVARAGRGRVWTGADAAANGLVDELAALEDAADIASRRAGLPPDAPFVPYPRVNPLDRLRAPESSEDRAAAAWLGSGLLGNGLLGESYGPVAQLAARLGLPGRRPAAAAGQLADQLTCLRPRGARSLRRSERFRGVSPRASTGRTAHAR